ncbi:MAG: hypothetical protein AABW75_01345 [Nanoarchaeota archaeon]
MTNRHVIKRGIDEHNHHYCEFLSSACMGGEALQLLRENLSRDIGYVPHLWEIDMVSNGAPFPDFKNLEEKRRLNRLKLSLNASKYRKMVEQAVNIVRHANHASGIRDHVYR